MPNIFEVKVPFISGNRASLGHTMITLLPKGEIRLLNILLKEINEGYYIAVLKIEATYPNVAKETGIIIVERLLELFAVNNDLFTIEIPSITTTIIEVSDSEIQENGNLIFNSNVFITDSIDVTKIKNNFEFETNALSNIKKCPDYIIRGIELNYNAVRAASSDVRFFLFVSALEILAWKKLGSPISLLKSKLKKEKYKEFKTKFGEFLLQWNFTEEEQDRLINYLCNTNKEKVGVHLTKYLSSVGQKKYNFEEVNSWWEMRGKIAHGEYVDKNILQKALNQINIAVQSSLRYELDSL